ncbi:hypothetical protein N658DRAFT_569503 [Parathielavia hyrcaniae]|uniref:Uncharacterized protein n=1 Tax=Parathielavia hyrcaniae TaxID=113614 RepID=A0AAN6PSG4_9PEZI|nr:hypothetical protein N658DRAFT_569503 [Parathielavia hyrcaniae]
MATHSTVFKLRFTLAMQDPDMPQPRYHHLIFVESNEQDHSGFKFHVTGDITSTNGMVYQSIPYHDPKLSKTLHSSELLGYTDAANFKSDFDNVLRGCRPPPQQKAFNPKTMKTEPFKNKDPKLTFYAPGEARKPLKKCTEWTEEQAIPALRNAKPIVPKKASPSPPGSRPGSRGGRK